MLKNGVDLHPAVFNKLPKGRVLDVGSGMGELARKLASLRHQRAIACQNLNGRIRGGLEPSFYDMLRIELYCLAWVA